MSNDQIDQLADAVADRLNGQLSGIRKDMENGFTEINGRLGKVEGRLGKVEGRLAEVEGRLAEVEEIVSDTASKVDQLTDWYQELNGRVTDLENR